MSTFSDSKIKVCRVPFVCLRCKQAVTKGQEYLCYKWGQRNDSRVCLSCAENCTELRSISGHEYRTHVYRFCAAMIERFGKAPSEVPV